jgi:hypothetical protein
VARGEAPGLIVDVHAERLGELVLGGEPA